MIKNKIITDFDKWKEDHPDPDYQYDECHEFISNYGRGEILELMEHVSELQKNDIFLNVPTYDKIQTIKYDKTIHDFIVGTSPCIQDGKNNLKIYYVGGSWQFIKQ